MSRYPADDGRRGPEPLRRAHTAPPNWPANHVDLHCHIPTARTGCCRRPTLLPGDDRGGPEIAALADHDTLAGYRLLRDQIATGDAAR